MVIGKINWGILATGRIARKFASDIMLVKDAQLVAVASRSKEKSKAFAREFNISKSYSSYQELVSDKSIDAVYIATPHVFHFENAMMCLEAGKHVLCEKPVGMNSFQLKQMIEKAREKNLFFMEALWTRFIPSYIKYRKLVLGGEIGDIKLIQSDFGFIAPVHIKNRQTDKKLGGGSLLDIGIYPVFLALDIAGEPNHIQASAILNSDGIDESCQVSFTYDQKNIMANLFSSFVINTPVESVIYGTEGYIRLNRRWHAPSSIELKKAGNIEYFDFDKRGFGYEYEISEVNKCIKEGKNESEIFPLTKSVQLHRILDAIRKKINLYYAADQQM
jgi:predicted dehydrogenase